MAKAKTAANPIDDADTPQPATGTGKTVKVTYRPIHATDPNSVKWNGVRFHANEPVALDPKRHVIIVPLKQEMPQADGTVQTRTKDTEVSMVELAKANPSFEVEGFPRAKHVVDRKRVVPPPGAEWADDHKDEIDEEAA